MHLPRGSSVARAGYEPAFSLLPFLLETSVDTYFEYLRTYSQELGSRIVEMYLPVQGPNDPIAKQVATLLRKPLPAQALTITGLAKHLKTTRSVRIVGECGTGKTLMSIGVAHTHADGAPYSTIAMCPPHLVLKWAREAHHRPGCSRLHHLRPTQRWRSDTPAWSGRSPASQGAAGQQAFMFL
jgi:hypothetical protein